MNLLTWVNVNEIIKKCTVIAVKKENKVYSKNQVYMTRLSVV